MLQLLYGDTTFSNSGGDLTELSDTLFFQSIPVLKRILSSIDNLCAVL
jgi:hypothetical protein